MDDSIIDITNLSQNIESPKCLQKYVQGVPFWEHQYINSFDDILEANNEQFVFYKIFKTYFKNGGYLDLEGNDNYAFILLFNLLGDYAENNDFKQLRSSVITLGIYYPGTYRYGIQYLDKILNGPITINDQHLPEDNYYTYEDHDFYYWRLGNRYKEALGLNSQEASILNKVRSNTNNFSRIEYCRIEIMKLFLATISELETKYFEKGSTIKIEFTKLSDLIIKKQVDKKIVSWNYKYLIVTVPKEIYEDIYKHCENAVRELYGHKRKLKTGTYYSNPEVVKASDLIINTYLREILPAVISKTSAPDLKTEVELNKQNTTRWKLKYKELTKKFNKNATTFFKDILSLGELNKKNTSIENIYYEATKFISKYDKETSLLLYVNYIYHNLKSRKFTRKPITKAVHKILFKSIEQFKDFEKIINELAKHQNLNRALVQVPSIYQIKRKKIEINKSLIKEVEQKHLGTVNLLNEYLEEIEVDVNMIKDQVNDNKEIKITSNLHSQTLSPFKENLSLNDIQISFLEYFAKNNFLLTDSQLSQYTKSKGIFKNQLIDSINECCYETIDDILIEEEDDEYTVEVAYYQKISLL